jgi:hypothetical protein
LVILTWLQQLQQYFYNCPERDKIVIGATMETTVQLFHT